MNRKSFEGINVEDRNGGNYIHVYSVVAYIITPIRSDQVKRFLNNH